MQVWEHLGVYGGNGKLNSKGEIHFSSLQQLLGRTTGGTGCLAGLDAAPGKAEGPLLRDPSPPWGWLLAMLL